MGNAFEEVHGGSYEFCSTSLYAGVHLARFSQHQRMGRAKCQCLYLPAHLFDSSVEKGSRRRTVNELFLKNEKGGRKREDSGGCACIFLHWSLVRLIVPHMCCPHPTPTLA